MTRLIAKVALLVAMLLMPLGMTAAPAQAAHHGSSASMPMQHCPEQAPNHESTRGFSECTMACSAALPAMELPHGQHLPTARVSAEPVSAPTLHGLHPDTATPPPKLS